MTRPDIDSTSDDWFSAAAKSTVTSGQDENSGGAADPVRRDWKRRRTAAVLAVTLVLLGGAAVGAVGAVHLMTRAPNTATAPAVPLSTTPAPVPAAAAEMAVADVSWCAGHSRGEPVTMTSTDPGAAAIWRFEKAFYFDRNPAAARSAGAPEAVMASADRLRAGIATLEPSVEFCVLADPTGPGVYDVTVYERGPGIDPRASQQRFTTADIDGSTVITAITRR